HAALDCGAADVRRAAAAAGLREGARATVEGAAAAIGNHPAVRALGGTCRGGAARAERLLGLLDAYPAAAALIGPTRLAVRYAGTSACGTPPDDDESGGEHRHEERHPAGQRSPPDLPLCWSASPTGAGPPGVRPTGRPG